MTSLAVALMAVATIVLSPFPTVAKVLALVPILIALLMAALEAVLVAVANVRAQRQRDAATVKWLSELRVMADADEADWQEWLGQAAVSGLPISLPTVRKVTRFPSQRQPGSAR